jgi:methylmalonyl-CoA mutase
VNMLRSTTESMSAVLAGADSLTVNPFDSAFSKPSDFSERVARNTQIILKEESYLDKVVDPAAGSYYIESLTDSIASEAWKLFLETEQRGGFLAAFKSGFIQNQVTDTAKKRDLNIATRKEILLGTNQYPNFSEVFSGKPLTDSAQKSSGIIAEPLHLYRASHGFESLRISTDNTGKRPKAFMLTIGNPIIRKARAAFSSNFFACAGYEIIDNAGFATVEEGVKEALAMKSDMVIICSSDEEYPDVAPKAFELLKDKTIFVVAGAPACMEELKQKGIEHFIHVKSNVLETLVGFNKLLGIQ